jgi:hypothetical protein
MPFTQDIAATYRGPGKVVRRLVDAGQREDRALAILMGACVILFVAQWPRLSREAHLTGQDINGLLAGALAGWLLFAPLGFYLLSWLLHLIMRVFRGQGPSFNARIAIFWGLLAATPLALLNGLVAGFIGPGPALTLVGVVWIGVLLWFWIAGMRAVYRGDAA